MSASDVANVSQIFSFKTLVEVVNETMPYWFPIALNLYPLMCTLKPQSKGPLYSNTVIGTLAVDGWAVIIWYSE